MTLVQEACESHKLVYFLQDAIGWTPALFEILRPRAQRRTWGGSSVFEDTLFGVGLKGYQKERRLCFFWWGPRKKDTHSFDIGAYWGIPKYSSLFTRGLGTPPQSPPDFWAHCFLHRYLVITRRINTQTALKLFLAFIGSCGAPIASLTSVKVFCQSDTPENHKRRSQSLFERVDKDGVEHGYVPKYLVVVGKQFTCLLIVV